MRKIFLIMLMLFLTHQTGYCDSPSVQVELTAQKSEIGFGEYEVPIEIKITNTETENLRFPNFDYMASGHGPVYRSYLVADDPAFELNQNSLIGTNGEIPMIILKQGESYSKSMGMRIRAGRQGGSVTFKVGFKAVKNSLPVWSNPVTVSIGGIGGLGQQELKFKIEASLDTNEIMQGKTNIVHVRITNTSDVTQSLRGPGIPAQCDSLSPMDTDVAPKDGSCGWSFAPIMTDNRSVFIDTGTTSCNGYFRQYDGLTLKPGEVWERDCKVYYESGPKQNPQPVTFRIGIVSSTQNPIWSDELTAKISEPSNNNGS